MKRMHLFSNNNVVVPRLVHRLDVFGFVSFGFLFFPLFVFDVSLIDFFSLTDLYLFGFFLFLFFFFFFSHCILNYHLHFELKHKRIIRGQQRFLRSVIRGGKTWGSGGFGGRGRARIHRV